MKYSKIPFGSQEQFTYSTCFQYPLITTGGLPPRKNCIIRGSVYSGKPRFVSVVLDEVLQAIKRQNYVVGGITAIIVEPSSSSKLMIFGLIGDSSNGTENDG